MSNVIVIVTSVFKTVVFFTLINFNNWRAEFNHYNKASKTLHYANTHSDILFYWSPADNSLVSQFPSWFTFSSKSSWSFTWSSLPKHFIYSLMHSHQVSGLVPHSLS